MKEIYTLRKDDLDGALYRRIILLIRKNQWTWQSTGATFGLALGMLAITTGILLWPFTRFLSPGNFSSYLNVLETVCFVVPFPLLALGAHCLDLLEKAPPVLPLRDKTQFDGSERVFRLRAQIPHRN
jgi:hypothetical protein